MIPQKPTAITVVPNSPETLQNVLGQARGQGIKVVSHEATGIQNADIDIEAFDNAAFGRQIMQNLAQCMGQQGNLPIRRGPGLEDAYAVGRRRP